MITIIFGPPRVGKTAYMVYLLNEACFDSARNRKMRLAIEDKIVNGFNLTVPKHCVSANFEVFFKKQGCSSRAARFINPYKLGFSNSEVVTHFLLPYETIGITEAQKYFNSRDFKNFRDWQSRLYEQHGHLGINILMDTQRPDLIDVNIRELSDFIEICNLSVEYHKINGRFVLMTWTIRYISNAALYRRYMDSGKTDKSCYTERTVISYVNVFELYNSFSCAPKFYAGHFHSDYDLTYCQPVGSSILDMKKYLVRYDDEKPEGLLRSNKGGG